MIKFKCSCGNSAEVSDDFAGKQGKCPACGLVLTIPVPLSLAEPIQRQGGEETLGNLMLALPVLAGGLTAGCYLAAEEIPGPLITVATILLTAVLATIEATGSGKGNYRKGYGPISWFLGLSLLWCIFYPMYMYHRRRWGLKNRLLASLVVALVWLGLGVGVPMLAAGAGGMVDKPDMPIALKYRESSVGQGYVVGLTNQSNRHLEVVVTARNPTTGEEKKWTLGISPADTEQLGWLEDWAFESGETVVVQHADYKTMRCQIP